MSTASPTGVAVARAYFATQAVAGVAWWIAVFASSDVQRWTLGQWEPALLVAPDLAFFVGASAVAAARTSRVAALVAAVWTGGSTIALTLYGLITHMAGWGIVLMVVATVGTAAAAATIWFGFLPTDWFFVGPFSFRVATAKPGYAWPAARCSPSEARSGSGRA